MPKARANGIDLFYESFGEGEPLILIMGIGAQMVLWDEDFCRALAAQGFRVIRFDNRDVGHSSQLDELQSPKPRDALLRRLLGRPIQAPYTLDDMADDAAGLLDVLAIPSAHVVGMSLGGMIAQCMVLRHPQRVRSLALLMSNSGELWSNAPRPSAFRALVSKVNGSREQSIERQIRLFRVLGYSPHRTPEARIAELAGLHHDRGVYPRGFARQFAAMLASPGRLSSLRKVRTPCVVIHGANDPLVHPSGGRLLAAAIPGARLLLIENMGHDLAPSVWPAVIAALRSNADRDLPTKISRLSQWAALFQRAQSTS